jgi:hypothetical protein
MRLYAKDSRRCSYLATKEAGQQDGENGVENDGTSKASNGLLPHRDVDIAISLHGEEVAVDAEYYRRTAELERIQRRRAKLQSSTAKTHGRCFDR